MAGCLAYYPLTLHYVAALSRYAVRAFLSWQGGDRTHRMAGCVAYSPMTLHCAVGCRESDSESLCINMTTYAVRAFLSWQGGDRTRVAFATFNSTIQFYSLNPSLQQVRERPVRP